MCYRRLPQIAISVSLALALAASSAGTSAQEKLDVGFVTSRPMAAVVLHPRRLLENRQFQMMPIEVFQAAVEQESAIDILKVQEAVFLLTLDPAPLPAWIVRFSEPYDRDAVIKRVSDGEGPEIAKHQTHRVKKSEPLLIAFPDETTILLAPADELSEMLSGERQPGPLAERLRRTDASEALSAVILLDPLRPMIQMGMTQLPPTPPQYRPFLDVPNLVKSLELHLRLDDQMESAVVFEAVDDDAADKLDGLLDEAIELGQAALADEFAQMRRRDPGPVTDATERYARRMIQLVADSVDRQRTDTRLALRVQGELAGAPVTSGVLISLLLPAVQAAREAARQSQSTNNLKYIGLAMMTYADAHKHFPGRARFKDGKPLLSWRVEILPYLDQKVLYDQFHLDEPWDSEHNRTLVEHMPAVFQNPSLSAEAIREGKTNYLAPTGAGTMFKWDSGASFGSFRDGTSNTIMVVEADEDRAVVWTQPDDLEIDPEKPLEGLGHLRPNGFLTVFADGHARLIQRSIDLRVLANLFNPLDGQPTPDEIDSP